MIKLNKMKSVLRKKSAIQLFQELKSENFQIKIESETINLIFFIYHSIVFFPFLYWFYYHTSRKVVSSVCGIFQ